MTRLPDATQRGVALMAVLMVLAALLAIAVPFSMSMRNQERSAQVASYQTKSQKSAWAALSMAEESLSATSPERDQTPYHDGADELRIDLESIAERYGAQVNDSRGSIWSVRAEDEQGKIDVNQVSPYLLGNLLGSAILTADIDATETAEIAVDSTAGFPEQGILWLEGEIVLYRSKTERSFNDLDRARITSVLTSLKPAEHLAGTTALDYRVITAMVRAYKLRAGEFIGYAGVRGLKDIASFGEMAFLADELDDWEVDLTAHAVVEAGRFWGGARSILASDALGDAEPNLYVQDGANLGAGSVVRIRSADGARVEYNLVARTDSIPGGNTVLWLQEPLQGAYAADEAIVDAVARAPVNINTCSRRVLIALLKGLRLGDERPISRNTAELIAERIAAARPILGEKGLLDLLLKLEEQGDLEADGVVRTTLMLNAMAAGDPRLWVSTAPFTYRNLGVFSVEAAVSENLEAGREAARLFAAEIAEVRPSGERLTLLTSQMDFYEAMRGSRTGKYWTTFPTNLLEPDDRNQPPVALRSALDWRRHPELAGDDVAQTVATHFARLAPLRKDGYRDLTEQTEPRVLHFDEPKDQGETGCENQDGWNTAQKGALHLEVASPLVNLLNARRWVWPFCFEGWFTIRPGTGEAILFDAGEEPIRNRIFAYFDSEHETLVFRVADGTVPDFSAGYQQNDQGKVPLTQMAEIRYSFDDGLAFEEDVPYHLSFSARGSKPSDLTLFVDGVPRGRRAFQTRLLKDISAPANPGPFANIQGYAPGQNQTLKVVDAELFPDQGVVRIGDELIEYTSKTKDALVVSATSGDPFGRRAARGSFGQVHEESEAVELYGYAAVLMSQSIPNGNLGLGGALGEFGVAMVDPEAQEAKTNISALPTAAPAGATGLNIGRGVDGTVQSLPLVQLGKPGGSLGGGGKIDFFNRDGGFALIISSPVAPPSNGANFQVPIVTVQGAQNVEVSWGRPWITSKGEYVGMSEVVYYSSFDGGRLNGITRAGPGFLDQTGPWAPVANLKASANATPVDEAATRGHVHISQWLVGGNSSVANQHDKVQPIFVLPISVGRGSNNLGQSYPIPEMLGSGGQGGGTNAGSLVSSTRPEMVQIGSGFPSTGSTQTGGTEWVRYDALARGQFVRDHPVRLRLAAFALGRVLTERFTAKSGTAPSAAAVGRAINFELSLATQDAAGQIATDAQLSADLLSGNYPEAAVGGGILAFRGVLGTGARAHAQGETLLPVFRTVRGPDVTTARPGPRDFVTILDPDNDIAEEHLVNFAYAEPDVEGWGGAACHLAFDAAVKGRIEANYQELFASADKNDLEGQAFAALQNANVESRDFTRLLKFPSGELPMTTGEEIVFGGDFQGNVSPREVTIDELEFFNPETPSTLLPRHPRYVLSREVDEKGKLYLDAEMLRYNVWDRAGVAIKAISPVDSLPKDGVVLLIDDELIAISDIVFNAEEDQEAELEIAVNGRGYLGTPIQHHRARTAVRDLTWMRVSRLEKSLKEDGSQLVIADDTDFADAGVVQMGRELIGYTRKQDDTLIMPTYQPSGDPIGLLRGSYGTEPEAHQAGTLAYQFPARYADRYRAQADDPELAYVGVHLKARNAFFKEIAWQSEGETELCDLVVQTRVGGRGSFTGPPGSDADVNTFDRRTVRDKPMSILRQGDDLELRVFVRYRPGAFDSQAFDPALGATRGGSNEWKRAPRLQLLGVDWIGGPARVAYEEWR